jgi:hypothetical protein
MPTNTPRTTCVARSRMKFRRIRDVYCEAATVSATITIEKETPATVIIEVAMACSIPLAPSAPAPKSHGHRSCASVPT